MTTNKQKQTKNPTNKTKKPHQNTPNRKNPPQILSIRKNLQTMCIVINKHYKYFAINKQIFQYTEQYFLLAVMNV